MRDFDEFGRLLAEYQSNIFLNSAEEFSCSSPVFIRRFMKSDFAYFLDKAKSEIETITNPLSIPNGI